MYRPLSA